jgi:hypothetical protein
MNTDDSEECSARDKFMESMKHVVIEICNDGIAKSYPGSSFSIPKDGEEIRLLQKINEAIIQDRGMVSQKTASLLTGNEYSDPALEDHLKGLASENTKVFIADRKYAIQIRDEDGNTMNYLNF